MENILIRRSVRTYKDIKVENEKIEKMLRAAMQAPSAGNQRPWEFIVVENKEKLKGLSQVCQYSKLVANAPLAIVLLADEKRMVFPENWEQDMGAATQNLLLEAVELDLGAVWLGVAPFDDRMGRVRDLFDLEGNIKPYAIVAVGYPKDGQGNKFVDRFDESRIHYENY